MTTSGRLQSTDDRKLPARLERHCGLVRCNTLLDRRLLDPVDIGEDEKYKAILKGSPVCTLGG